MPSNGRLEVILKISEVCNIACTYCYYFFSGDDRPLERPARISDQTIEGLVRFLNGAFEQGELTFAQIDLHGGEPLMLGKARFSALCRHFRSALEIPYRLCVTTNAMLIDAEWIDILAHHDVAVCISLDGPRHVHDRRRIDKRSRGTYGRVIAGLEQLQAASAAGLIAPPSALCVVDPGSDARAVYAHLVHDLNLRCIDFLLPDVTHDSPDREPEAAAAYMQTLMQAWLEDDDAGIVVRVLRSTLTLLVSGRSYLAGFGSGPPFAITVGSDGSIDTDDFLKPCGVDVIETRLNIATATLAEVLAHGNFDAVAGEIAALPDDCAACEFAQVCAGGQATHRFSAARRFNNRSVYCAANFAMFRTAAGHLLRTGVSPSILAERLLPAAASEAIFAT